jgi:hypothetical protein
MFGNGLDSIQSTLSDASILLIRKLLVESIDSPVSGSAFFQTHKGKKSSNQESTKLMYDFDSNLFIANNHM